MPDVERSVPSALAPDKQLCPHCHEPMTLTSVKHEKPGVERRIFICGKCRRAEFLLVKVR